MLDDDGVIELFERHRAIVRGTHAVYASGDHGNVYFRKERVLAHPREAKMLYWRLMERACHLKPRAVVGPAVWGAMVAQGVAACLADRCWADVLAIPADRTPNGRGGVAFSVRRDSNAFIAGQPVLVVDDVLSTGGSVRGVTEAVRNQGGSVVGIAVLVSRGGVSASQVGDVPELISLASISCESWDERDCPLCRDGVPVDTTLGHGAEFVARREEERLMRLEILR